jgi:hypothetical protein
MLLNVDSQYDHFNYQSYFKTAENKSVHFKQSFICSWQGGQTLPPYGGKRYVLFRLRHKM